jgi:polyisoprenoid-binding protein YceI
MIHKTKWSIDQAQSNILFKVGSLIFSSVEGWFKTFDAEIITIDENFETSEINFRIDSSTITTGDNKRDEHLKSIDFFDAEKYKYITFQSDSISEINTHGNHELTGNLTIKNITKPITFNVRFSEVIKDRWDNEKTGFIITGKIHRQTWGLTWNSAMETGGLLLSEDAILTCGIHLVKSGQKILVTES